MLVRTTFFRVIFVAAIFLASDFSAFAAPVAQEPVTATTNDSLLTKLPPGPPPSSVPDWAAPGLITFSRWDGGPIETAKGFLSGWPALNPPLPDYVYSTTNWYDLKTVQYLRQARFNLVWVTFSAGFSIETEKIQRDLLKTYIAECHKHGIHVLAYQSLANIFWEEMFQNEPESKNWLLLNKNGEPIPYCAGNYSKTGRVTRYMADLSKSGWRNYLKKRIDLAIEAGADGIMYDNCLAGSTAEMAGILQEMMQYSLSKKKDFLLMANFHRDKYFLNRLLNCLTTEDGGEPGVFSEKNLKAGPRAGEQPFLLKSEHGFLVNNVGLLRTFENLSEGWKPTMVESNLREVGVRETHIMKPERYQLAIAEAMMYGGIANETFVELRFARDLYWNTAEALTAWQAIGQYNDFFIRNAEYYRRARSVAPLAVVLDNRSEGQSVMNGLASRGVLFNVLYEHELTLNKLKPYSSVLLLSADTMRKQALEALENYLHQGGRLFAVEAAATKDEKGQPQKRPAWFNGKTGRGTATYWSKTPQIDELAKILLADGGKPLANITAPSGVLYNITQQADRRRLMVHILNYLPHPVENTTVTITGKRNSVQLLTPDRDDTSSVNIKTDETTTKIEIPRLKIYSVLVFDE